MVSACEKDLLHIHREWMADPYLLPHACHYILSSTGHAPVEGSRVILAVGNPVYPGRKRRIHPRVNIICSTAYPDKYLLITTALRWHAGARVDQSLKACPYARRVSQVKVRSSVSTEVSVEWTGNPKLGHQSRCLSAPVFISETYQPHRHNAALFITSYSPSRACIDHQPQRCFFTARTTTKAHNIRAAQTKKKLSSARPCVRSPLTL